jgi:hypothetical protein
VKSCHVIPSTLNITLVLSASHLSLRSIGSCLGFGVLGG